MPVIPLFDDVGKDGTLSPSQMVREVPKPNAGVMLGATVTENVTGGAHTPASGVNV